jgi:hypothetical protein
LFLSTVPFEIPREKQLPQGKGKVLHSFMMATHPSLNYQQNVEVMHFMEAEVLKMAHSKGFGGIFTTNTNPLTQVCVDTLWYFCRTNRPKSTPNP